MRQWRWGRRSGREEGKRQRRNADGKDISDQEARKRKNKDNAEAQSAQRLAEKTKRTQEHSQE
jgi:hypothetical protein